MPKLTANGRAAAVFAAVWVAVALVMYPLLPPMPQWAHSALVPLWLAGLQFGMRIPERAEKRAVREALQRARDERSR